ncbi:MAG TPA: hypothetical protein VFB63_01525 [Bryobacteraceae bacterium]|nr:hypothetical protein [Bryobacteraceae bacterium]
MKSREQLLIENERMRDALNSLIGWWEEMPNDIKSEFTPTPYAIKKALKILGTDSK